MQEQLSVYVTAGTHAHVCDGRVFPPLTCFQISFKFFCVSVRVLLRMCETCVELKMCCTYIY